MMNRFVHWVTTFPKLVVGVILLLSVLLAAAIPRITIELDVDKQIPQGHPLVEVGKRLETLFGGRYLTVVGFYPKVGTVYTPEVLAKVSRVTDALETIPGIKQGALLSLTSKNLKDVRVTEDSIEVAPFTAELPTTPDQVARFKAKVQQNQALTSLLVSHDGRATSILLDFDDFEKAGGARGFYSRLDEILQAERDDSIRIVAAGAPSVLHFLRIYTVRIAWLFLLTLVMIGYLHYRAFLTLQGMFIPLVTALLGVVWALGLIGWFEVPMDPWNMMTPILILAVGAGHSVQILKRYYEEFERFSREAPQESPTITNRRAVVEATTKMGSVMVAAGSIAGLSFLSLLAMKVPSMQSFGLCTAFGIFSALLIELTLIPALRMLLPAPKLNLAEKKQEFFEPLLHKLADFVRTKRDGKIFVVAVGLVLVAIAGIARLETRNSLREQFYDVATDVPIFGKLLAGPMEGFRLADARTAGTRVVQVLIEGDEPDALTDPSVLRAMGELGEFASSRPHVGRAISLADVLKSVVSAVDGGAAPPELPETREAVAQLLLFYQMSGSGEELRSLTDPQLQNGVITIYLKTDDHHAIKELVRALEERASGLFEGLPVRVAVGGGVTNAVALNETIVQGKMSNLIQISALVFLITSLTLRSLLGGLLVLLPLATSALVNLGVMGWTSTPLSMGTAAISAMAVGIGADYAIYFIFRVREQMRLIDDLREAVARALLTSGVAISYVATAVAGGYLCLVLSLSKVHVQLGVLVALTMVVSSLSTLIFLPYLLLRLRPSFLEKANREPGFWARGRGRARGAGALPSA